MEIQNAKFSKRRRREKATRYATRGGKKKQIFMEMRTTVRTNFLNRKRNFYYFLPFERNQTGERVYRRASKYKVTTK